jgi:RP/EB family microtubule-associated protein
VSSVTRASSASGQKENAANASNPDPSSSRAAVLPAASNPRKPVSSSNTSAAAARHEAEIRALKAENAALDAKYAELERATAEIELTLQTVESERDFYFEKLRGIEVMLQVYKEREEENEGSGDVSRVMDKIFKVMYATMEDDVVVDDEGNVS